MTTQVIDGTITFPGAVTFLGGVTGSGGNVVNYNTLTAVLTGAVVVNTGLTGSVYLLRAATGPVGFSIPTAVGNYGLNYTFIVVANANGFSSTLTSLGGNFQGTIISAAGVAHKAPGNTLVSSPVATTLLAGDRVIIISDGTNWSTTVIGSGNAGGWA